MTIVIADPAARPPLAHSRCDCNDTRVGYAANCTGLAALSSPSCARRRTHGMLQAVLRQAARGWRKLSAGLGASCKRPANVRAWKRPMLTTVFRNAAWVVAWDEARAAHVYRRDVDLAIRGSEIVFIGKRYPETGDSEVDCSQRLLLPGLVNIHTHPT